MKNDFYCTYPYNTRRKIRITKAIKIIQTQLRGQLVRNRLFRLTKYNFCSICLENIKYSEGSFLNECEHIFHKNCLNNWLETNTTCPNCRTDISYVPPTKVSPFYDFIQFILRFPH